MFTDEVVCIDASGIHSLNNGSIYPFNGLKRGFCKCAPYLIDIGLKCSPRRESLFCPKCFAVSNVKNDGILWLNYDRFTPIDSVDISEAMEVLEKEAFKI